MNNISENNRKELEHLLEDLITIIKTMSDTCKDYVLVQNGREAKEWLEFLYNHIDKEELKSLEDEIANQLFARFDVQIEQSELDVRRTELMKEYLWKSNQYLK